MRTSLHRLALIFLVALVVLSTGSTGVAQDATPAASPTAGSPIALAVGYITSQQAADGGFLGFSGTSDPGATADAVLALVAASTTGVAVDVTAAVAYLTANAQAYASTGAGQAAKLVLAISATGGNPRDLSGFDAVATIVAGQDAESGVYGTGVYDHCLAMLALVQAGEPFADPDQTSEALRARQIPDGSWSFDGTATAGAGDSNTTGIVIQALVAVGEDPRSETWQNVGGSLLLFQNPSGAFRYTMEPPDDNLFATLQAVPAVAGVALPIASVGGTPVALPEAIPFPTCTAEEAAVTPEAGAELPCAA